MLALILLCVAVLVLGILLAVRKPGSWPEGAVGIFVALMALAALLSATAHWPK